MLDNEISNERTMTIVMMTTMTIVIMIMKLMKMGKNDIFAKEGEDYINDDDDDNDDGDESCFC